MAYKDKILMLICRTYEYETYVEQKRIQNLCALMDDPLEDWMKQDLVNLMVIIINLKYSKMNVILY